MIYYVKGDATRPRGVKKEPKIIAHVCNDVGAWGAGFVLALSRRWRAPRKAYKTHHHNAQLRLGTVHFVRVEADLEVANMVAQRGLRSATNLHPLDYGALGDCLREVALRAEYRAASVHMPRIGCGLGGGDWSVVERLIDAVLCLYADVFVYDLEDM